MFRGLVRPATRRVLRSPLMGRRARVRSDSHPLRDSLPVKSLVTFGMMTHRSIDRAAWRRGFANRCNSACVARELTTPKWRPTQNLRGTAKHSGARARTSLPRRGRNRCAGTTPAHRQCVSSAMATVRVEPRMAPRRRQASPLHLALRICWLAPRSSLRFSSLALRASLGR